MIKIDFSQQNRDAANSFHQQRNIIKKVCRGEKVNCEHCQQVLTLTPPVEGVAYISCQKGCTKVELELDS
ncbi:hypothetical protein [Psychrobium sp. 1_MG-2023]|uniref:hypothetical protein n=1 Tax=Psychrobium sp. 1_MG-2023 TaxID=3062624 RepID=UPI000C31F2EB|nr:hypothetical protein [Psychrobium sp. 1_MG-2023]MDP2560648.1 hypothetical protein [Psychrobium sp. 1_MG-2023]PKF56545.1 hypothetical protein CW748_08650 [Alteromonadales bacterium alter-6D02]